MKPTLNSGLKELLTAVSVVGPVALLYTPMLFRWFGFQEVNHAGIFYAVQKSEERTILINNPGGGLFLEYRIDKNNDGTLDSHYLRSTIPSRLQGYVIVSKPITPEDHTLLEYITSRISP